MAEHLGQPSGFLRSRDSEKSSIFLNDTQQNRGKNPGRGPSFAVLAMRSKLSEAPDRPRPLDQEGNSGFHTEALEQHRPEARPEVLQSLFRIWPPVYPSCAWKIGVRV